MFCKFCGHEIDNDSIFCVFCGKKMALESSSCKTTKESILNTVNPQDERKGLSIYFNDICRLEFIRNSLDAKISELNEKIKTNELCRYRYWTYSWNHRNLYYGDSVRFIFGFDGREYYFYVQSENRGTDGEGMPWHTFYPDVNFKENHKLTKERLEKLTSPVTKETVNWRGKIKQEPVDIWKPYSTEFGGSQLFSASWRGEFLNLFEKAKTSLAEDYRVSQEIISASIAELKKIRPEFEKVNELLKSEYNLNIIPNKFRNLEAMWYICDFFDSSNEDLSEIFMHLDMDAIKMELNNIITNQQEIIINQAIEISQNKGLLATNQAILDRLASIEDQSDILVQNTNQIVRSTRETSKWTKIAANNAEACAWISLAEYFK